MIGDVLGLTEMAGIITSSVIAKHAYIVLFLDDTSRTQPYLFVGIACALLYHYVARAKGLNGIASLQRGSLEWRPVLGSLALAFLSLIAIAYVFKVSADFSRGWLITWFVLSYAVLIAGRALLHYLRLWLTNKGEFRRRVAVACVGRPTQSMLEAVAREPSTRLVAVFQIDPARIAEHANDSTISIIPTADLVVAAKQHDIDELIVHVPRLKDEQLSHIIDELKVLPVDIWLSMSDEEVDLPIYGFRRLGKINLLQVGLRPIDGWGLLAKQVIDYTLAGIAVLALLPLFLLIGVAIKLDTRGPVLFRQRRHGCNEHEIVVIKFRTMTDAEEGGNVRQATKNDPRVTRVGRFLRKTSLDELPQLINVLRGEMSLVGPRPHALVHNDYYRSRVGSYANRHKVKPGITGMAQINGLRGETDTSEKMRRRVEMDIYYIDNWSLWLDCKILVLTPIYGFVHRNAF